MATDASVEPLSQTTISPASPAASNVRRIFSMQAPIAASSFRQGMTTDTTGGGEVSWDSGKGTAPPKHGRRIEGWSGLVGGGARAGPANAGRQYKRAPARRD